MHLSILAIFKNESWNMREWLEHYLNLVLVEIETGNFLKNATREKFLTTS